MTAEDPKRLSPTKKRLGLWNRNQFSSKDPKRPITTQKDKWKHSNDSVTPLTTNCSCEFGTKIKKFCLNINGPKNVVT